MPTIYDPPVATYTAIGHYELASSVQEVSLFGFGGFRDLILVADFQASTGGLFGMRFNTNTSLYERNYLIGDGANSTGGQDTSYNYMRLKATGTFRTLIKAQINDYEQPKQKIALIRSNAGLNGAGGEVVLTSSRWPQTEPITSIQCFVTAGTFDPTATFTIYGVK